MTEDNFIYGVMKILGNALPPGSLNRFYILIAIKELEEVENDISISSLHQYLTNMEYPISYKNLHKNVMIMVEQGLIKRNRQSLQKGKKVFLSITAKGKKMLLNLKQT